MDTIRTDLLSRYPVPRHRLSVRDYHRLGETGILTEDDRVELLEGQLVDRSPIGPRHALVVDALTELLVMTFADRARVRVQNPVELDDGSEPQPDFALVRRRAADARRVHPGPDDVFLLIEVADSSLLVDSGLKMELYARAGIRELWIVDLTTDTVLVYRHPAGGRYGSVARMGAPDVLEVEALPGAGIPVADVLA